MISKEVFTVTAIVITFGAFYPYVRNILEGKVRPHVFSWIIWGVTTAVVFFAQLNAGGGIGAWPIGVSAAVTLFIALLAYIKRADITVTASDWCFFIAALISIPFWFFLEDPTWAVVILTIVDILGFAPTVRKAHADPYSESVLFFALFAIRNILVLTALESYSVATVLFPAAIAVSCVLLVLLISGRRGWRADYRKL